MRFLLSFILYFSLSSHFILAQEYRFLQYNNRQGLQNNLTKSMIQDQFGFIWVGTDNGFARFDGQNFETYNLDLPSAYVKGLLKTKKGEIFGSTDMGIVKITNKIESVSISTLIKGSNTTNDSTVHYAKLMYEDKNENLWISDDMAMCRYKNGQFKRYKFDNKLSTLTYYRTFSFIESKDGSIYIFSQNGYCFYFDPIKDIFIEITEIPKFINVNYALQTKEDKTLICTKDGIYELEFQSLGKLKTIQLSFPKLDASCLTINEKNEIFVSTWTDGVHILKNINNIWINKKLAKFPFDRTNYIMTDKQNNIFVCTDAGIVLIQENYFQSPVSIATQSYINSIGVSKYGLIFLPDGRNIYRIDSKDMAIKSTKLDLSAMNGEITVVVPSLTDKNKIWVSTSTSQVFYFVNEKLERVIELKEFGRTIFYSFEDSQGNLWACMDGIEGVVKISKDFQIKTYGKKDGLENRLLVIRENKKGQIVGGSMGDSTYLFEYLPQKDRFINISTKISFKHNNDLSINDLCFENNKIWIASSQGVLEYSEHKVSQLQTGYFTDNMIRAITIDTKGVLWYSIDKALIKYTNGTPIVFNESNGLTTISLAYRCLHIDLNNQLWLGTSLGLNFSKNDCKTSNSNQPILQSIMVNNENIPLNTNQLEFKKGSYLKVNFICLGFPGTEINYQYKLDGENEKWIDIYNKTELFLPDLTIGKHKLKIRAKQDGNYFWSTECKLDFYVLTPWYQKWWAFLLYIFMLSLCLKWLVNLQTKRYRLANLKLDHIVKERTKELTFKNADLEQKHEEILAQRNEIEIQKNELEKKSKNITSSIQYAQRIQLAVLSSNEILKTIFPNHFIHFQARDIVSGDFYYIKEINNNLIIAVADCTGHGVPGGFMSILGTTLLNEIVHKEKYENPGEILNQLRTQIKVSLQQTGKRGQQQDGMDISICCINLNNLYLEFAGANLPLYIFTKQPDYSFSLYEIKGNRMPIGVHPHDNIDFNTHTYQLKTGDIIYLFSDGLISQFGGEKGNKFKTKNLQNLLISIIQLPMDQQKILINENIKNWMGKYDQVDDILILGLEIK